MIGWLVVSALAMAAWLWLAVLRGGFWRTDQRLPDQRRPDRADPAGWPSVAVVIPARDEVEVLAESLPSLLAQDYPGPARVILVDDGSTDGTGDLARRLVVAGPAPDGRLPARVTTPEEPPAGWTGKLWAVAHGIDAAGDVDYLLITDADIVHGPGSLTALVGAATTAGVDLVSQMAMLRTHTRWERLVVPAFVYFFAMLFPFRWVNRPDRRTAAAAGGCMLVRRAALAKAGGPAAIRGAVIDDVALAGLVKRDGGRIWLGLAEPDPASPVTVRSVRPYPRLADLWRMVARSAYTQLRHSPWLLAGTVLGMAVLFVVPPAATVVGAVTASWPVLALGVAAWLVLAGTFVPMLRHYRLAPLAAVLLAVLLPVTAVLYVAMTVDSARRHWAGRGATWKGRSYG